MLQQQLQQLQLLHYLCPLHDLWRPPHGPCPASSSAAALQSLPLPLQQLAQAQQQAPVALRGLCSPVLLAPLCWQQWQQQRGASSSSCRPELRLLGGGQSEVQELELEQA